VGPGAGVDRCGKFRLHRDSIPPDHPARSELLYRLRYPDPHYCYYYHHHYYHHHYYHRVLLSVVFPLYLRSSALGLSRDILYITSVT
jgi:hypothetical protein